MTTYICKCGRTFAKNTEAGTTGFRMPDYGPDHECWGCPFVQTETWKDPFTNKLSDIAACRGSKVLDYQTDAYCCDSKGAALHVRTLDLEFIQAFFKDYLALPGHTYEKLYSGMDSPENGRRQYGFGFAANKQGDADRKALINRYFRSEGERLGELPSGDERLVRKDVTPEQEKEIVLNQIKEAKALAQEKEPEEAGQTGTVYIHEVWRYFVDRREETDKFAVFMRSTAEGAEGMKAEIFNIPEFDTFAEAQNALDGYAVLKGFTAENSNGSEDALEPEQTDDPPESTDGSTGYPEGAEEMNELAGAGDLIPDPPGAEVSEPDNGAVPKSGDAPAEQPPCDWKNASGSDDEEDDDQDEEAPAEVTGDPLDLRGDEFDFIVNPANDALNRFVAMLHAKKQHDGEINIKVTFECDGGSYIFGGTVSGKINLTMKPQKVIGDAVELQFDAQGNPIIPADREHQLSFDEVPAGGTATVDGKTGIVEHFEEGSQGQEDPPADEQQEGTGEDAPEEGNDEEQDQGGGEDDFPPFDDEKQEDDAS